MEKTTSKLRWIVYIRRTLPLFVLLFSVGVELAHASETPAKSIHIAFHLNIDTEQAMNPLASPVAQGVLTRTDSVVWNNFNAADDGSTFGARTVVDESGSDVGTTLTVTSAYAGVSGALFAGSTKDNVMMQGWYGFRDPEQIAVDGLPSGMTNGFHVVVFADSDSTSRTMTYLIGSQTQTIQDSGTFTDTFVRGGNYCVFSNLTGSSFILKGNAVGTRSAINGIEIGPGDWSPPPAIHAFSTSDYYVPPGTSVPLSWEVQDAASVRIDPGPGDVTALITNGLGSVFVTASTTTVYTLSVSNAAGLVQRDLQLGVGPPRPNILLFLVDDMGWQDTSEPFYYSNGIPVPTALNQRYQTPSMERLADQGIKFTRATAHPVCTPTRVSMMTGLNSARHHVTDWTHPVNAVDTGDNDVPFLRSPPDWRVAGVDTNLAFLPRLLSQLGYRTMMAGKGHFGPNSTPAGNPLNLGFDVSIGATGIGQPGSYLGTANYGTGTFQVPDLEAYHGTSTFLTEALTLEMKKEIGHAVTNGLPFFSYMSHYAVHKPFAVDTRFSADYPGLSGSELSFATMIEGMDKSLGDLMDYLEMLGVAEETLVIFLSDNGSVGPVLNEPLRGFKGTRYEGGTRVPMMIGWAKTNDLAAFQTTFPIPAGTVVDDIAAVYDLFPTLLEAAGGPAITDIDGYSLAPYLKGQPGPHRPQELVTHFPHGHNDDHYSTIVDGPLKLILNYADQSLELYNLETDISETDNLAAGNPETALSLDRRLARELDRMGAQYSHNINTSTDVPPLMPIISGADLDQDGIQDQEEDPNRNGLQDAGETDPDNADSDGDTTPDGAEKRIATDPLDSASSLRVQVEALLAGVRLSWPSQTGTVFDVESLLNLNGTWQVQSNAIAGSASGTSAVDMPRSSEGQFYRVVLKP